MITSLVTATHLLVALWIQVHADSSGVMTFQDVVKNFGMCGSKPDHCSVLYDPKRALVGCTFDYGKLCQYSCSLRQRHLSYGPPTGRRCASVCPDGYFLGLAHGKETCLRHRLSCPVGQIAILNGTSWHDVVCGYPDHRVLLDQMEHADPILIHTHRTPVESWLHVTPFSEILQLCRQMTDLEGMTSCLFHFEGMLQDMPSPSQSLYRRLQGLSLYITDKDIYEDTARQFIRSKDLDSTLSVRVLERAPWRLGDRGRLVLRTVVAVPAGMSHRYRLRGLRWYVGSGAGMMLVAAVDGTVVRSIDPRYSIAKGLDWTEMEHYGSRMQAMDISMAVRTFYCGLFTYARTEVSMYDTQHGGTVHLYKRLAVECTWGPELHPDCDCARALLDYDSPNGICSPTCISDTFAHFFEGPVGSNNDWTLEVTRTQPDTSHGARGRVLYGSVAPTAESVCLVTANVFDRLPGLTRDAPSAPLDVMRCDLVLLAFDVWLQEPPGSLLPRERYTPLDVRPTQSRKVRKVYVPVAAQDALAHIIRQGWGARIGVKVTLPQAERRDPNQEELAAVLEWILTVHPDRRNRAPRAVVIEANVRTVRSSDFAAINALYWPRIQVIPGLSAGQIADVMRTRGYKDTRRAGTAERVLREVGLLVSSHGAFLNVDTVSDFARSGNGCYRVKPGRWRTGEYAPDNPYVIRFPGDERYPERTGLMVFEELCKRSNNRAGIVVSLPTADYIPGAGCKSARLVNRHAKVVDKASSADRVHYALVELAETIADMAKWGVRRYSLGYLDYTFGNPGPKSTFAELSHLIERAVARAQTVHYRYTRNSTFGDGGYSYARVDGVYKLEAGMFFQRVAKGTPLTKSFLPVPEMPNLRLGLSSDMNVGAPLHGGGGHVVRGTVEIRESVPHGARVVDLNHKGAVAFVDLDRERLCVHFPASGGAPGDSLRRLPSFGIRSREQERKDDESADGDEEQLGREGERGRGIPPKHHCHGYVSSGGEHRARVSVQLPIPRAWRESAVLRHALSLRRRPRDTLTRAEEGWLSEKPVEEGWLSAEKPVKEEARPGCPHVQGPQGLLSTLRGMRLLAHVEACLGGSGSCAELGDYSENGWPRGGAGYPIAIERASDCATVLKMIILVRHGVRRVRLPCDLATFHFGSERAPSFGPAQGYYTRTQEPLIAAAKRYVKTVGLFTAQSTQRLARFYCLDREPMSSVDILGETYGCAARMNVSLRATEAAFRELGSLSRDSDRFAERLVKRLVDASSRATALCVSAMVFAILINISVLAMLCRRREGSARNSRGYGKVE